MNNTSQSTTEVTPVLILGGFENSLSIARSLGKKGIPVSVATTADSPVYSSRYCTKGYPIPENKPAYDHFKELLLGDNNEEIKGSVVFLCSDDGIAFVIKHREELDALYLLDIHQTEQQEAMLDKEAALKLAKKAAVAIPEFWHVENMDDVRAIANEVEYPATIRPHYSHLFQKRFNYQRFFMVENEQELLEKAALAYDNGFEFMVSEYIPGPDSLLSSYYAHYDKDGNTLFEFTKSIIRRTPNFGSASFHKAHWIPDTAAEGDKYFRSFNFTGLAMIEFKKDPRNGKLKVIEINARYSAAQPLLTGCGMDSSYLIYCFLTGKETPKITTYKQNVYLWSLYNDLKAVQKLLAQGEITIAGWLKSLMQTRWVLQYFSLTDPLPSIIMSYTWFKGHAMKLVKR